MKKPLVTDERRKLHIGMVVTYDLCEPGGGVKQHALQLADALRKRGDRVTLFGPSTRAIEEPDLRGFPGVLNVASNGSDNRIGILVRPWAIRRFMREQRFDILHIHEPLLPTLPYYVAWFSPGVPKLATFHAYAENPPSGLVFARRVFSHFVLPAIDRGIAVSEPAARHARIDWRGSLSIIPNGITTASFPVGQHRDTRTGLKLLFVGRIADERKGFDYVAQAVQRTRAVGLDVELHVVGELSNGASRDFGPGIVHHGPAAPHALASWYRKCDVLVAPSTGQESFGIVLLEAMSAARPILCSDIEGYRQSANVNGVRWAGPRDVDALERGIVELASRPDERRRLGESNAAYVKRFDWSVLAPQIRAEYLRTILARRTATEPVLVPRPVRHELPMDLEPVRTSAEAASQAASDA